MKKLLGKIVISITGVLAVLGLTSSDVKPIVKAEIEITKISETTPLYLAPAKEILSNIDNMSAWHSSHYSHGSHQSHVSHQSHYSHYSGY